MVDEVGLVTCLRAETTAKGRRSVKDIFGDLRV